MGGAGGVGAQFGWCGCVCLPRGRVQVWIFIECHVLGGVVPSPLQEQQSQEVCVMRRIAFILWSRWQAAPAATRSIV